MTGDFFSAIIYAKVQGGREAFHERSQISAALGRLRRASYSLDLSLSEIAEQKEISKQAVSDALKKSRELMDFYEETLHFNEMNQAYSLEVSDMMTRVERALEEFAAAHPEFSGEMKKIADLVFVGEKVDPDGEE